MAAELRVRFRLGIGMTLGYSARVFTHSRQHFFERLAANFRDPGGLSRERIGG